MAFQLVWEQFGVVARYAGDIDIGEVKAAQDQLHSDSRVDHARYLIVDALQVTGIRTGPRDHIDIWAYDAGASRRNPQLRKAFIAILPEFIEFVRWYSAMPKVPYPSRIFDNEADARKWLASEIQLPGKMPTRRARNVLPT